MSRRFGRAITSLAALLMTAESGTAEAQSVATKVTEFSAEKDLSALAFCPDGQCLAAKAQSAPVVYVCSLAQASCTILATTDGESLGILHKSALRYSPDGRLLALVHDWANMTIHPVQSVVHIWSVASGQLVHVIGDSQWGSTYPSLEFSPDGRCLVRLYQHRAPGDQLVVLGTSDWKPVWGLRTLPFQPQALALSPDGKTAALGGIEIGAPIGARRNPIWIISTTTHKTVRKIDTVSGLVEIVGISWSPHGEHIAVAVSLLDESVHADTLKVLDVSTGKVVASAAAPDEFLYGIKYARDGKYLIEDGTSGVVTIWNSSLTHVVQQINVGRTLNIARGPLAVSRDGRLLAVAAGPAISVWEFK